MFVGVRAVSRSLLTNMEYYSTIFYLLTPWCRVLLEKLTGLQLVKKFPTFHGTQRFITALTSVCHLSLSWASPIQSIYPHPTSRRSILILSTHLCLGLPSGLLPSGFPSKTLYTPLSLPIRATCPAHLILLDFITRTILGEEYKSFSSSLCSLLHYPLISSLLGPNILNTMFSNTLNFLSSRNVNDQVSHPYKTTGKIIVLYILISNFLDSNLEDKRFCTEWKQALPDLNLLLISSAFYYPSIMVTGVTKHVTRLVNISCNYSRTNIRLLVQDVPDPEYSRFSGFVLTFGNSQTKTQAARILQPSQTPFSRYTYHQRSSYNISHMGDLCYYLCYLCYPQIMIPFIVIVGLVNPRWIVRGVQWSMATY